MIEVHSMMCSALRTAYGTQMTTTHDDAHGETNRYFWRIRCWQCHVRLDEQEVEAYDAPAPKRSARCAQHPAARCEWAMEVE